MDRAPVVFFFFFGDRFQCVQAAQLSGQLCLLAVLALTSEEMMECGLETVQWIKVCCLYCCQARIFFFFSSSCPNSQETPGGEKVSQRGADKKSSHKESDCRWVCKC